MFYFLSCTPTQAPGLPSQRGTEQRQGQPGRRAAQHSHPHHGGDRQVRPKPFLPSGCFLFVFVFLLNHACASWTRASHGSLVSFSLLRLLHCLLSKSSSVSLSAYTQIRSLATAKGLKLQTLFSQYKNPICQVYIIITKNIRKKNALPLILSSCFCLQFLVESLHSRHMSASRGTPDQACDSANQRELALDILEQIAHAFDFPDLHRFLTVRQ